MQKVPHCLAVLLYKLQQAGYGPIRSEGKELRCRCPAHDDNSPSLYIALTPDKILVSCKAGCTAQAVCEAIDHDIRDLFVDANDEPIDIPEDLLIDTAYGDTSTGCGDPELRNAIYTTLLSQLELSTAHFESLRKRGLTIKEIERRGYKTADSDRFRRAIDALLGERSREQLLEVPGFVERYDRIIFQASKGFLIPARDVQGRILGLKMRHDVGYNGGKYTWASSREVSCGNLVHVPLSVTAPSRAVRLTEGELKADVATSLGDVPTISAPGVGSWQLAIPVLKALGAREVLLALDQDGKPGTLAAIEKALLGLTRAGFQVALEWWDGKTAKGIDDLLAAGSKPDMLTGLEAVVRVKDAAGVPADDRQPTPNPDLEQEPEAFPADVFPPVLEEFNLQVAEVTTTPPDFAGLTMLVTAGAAIGNSRALCLKKGVWYEAPRFYAVAVGDPASGKTPATDNVVRPYEDLQEKLVKDHKDKMEQFEQAQKEYERVVKGNRGLQEEERQPIPLVPEEPEQLERLVAINATVESLGPVLEENPRGLLSPQDEGSAWVRGMGQYKGGKGNDRQFYLSAWSGRSYMTDRKSQGGVPICIPRPFVNVICCMPPDMLSDLADQQGCSDGFLDRILFVFPKARFDAEWTDDTVSPKAIAAWEAKLSHLRALKMVNMQDGFPGYKVVSLSAAAKQLWVEWWNSHISEMRSPDLPRTLVGPWAKLKSYTARLALVLYYLWQDQTEPDDAEPELDGASMKRAVRLIDYFKSHLRLVYNRLRQSAVEKEVNEVIEWVQRNGHRCTARQLVRARKVADTEKAKKLLKEMEARGDCQSEYHDAGNNKKVQWFVFKPENSRETMKAIHPKPG